MAMTREEIEQKIRDLKEKMKDVNSEIGDWKISKYTEYEKAGKEPPFNIEEYNIAKDAVRAEINELEKLLEEME